jgi:hypothetical protein
VRLGVFHHVVPSGQTLPVTLADDTRRAGVDHAAATIAPLLAGTTLNPRLVAETAVRAAANFLGREALFTVPRWKAELPVATVKGISEADARRLARDFEGVAWQSTITVYADGREELGPWKWVQDPERVT